MGLGAVIGGVAAVGSAVIGASAAHSASKAQTQAANTAAQTQLSMYNQTRSDLSPFMSYGQNAFSQLANIFGFGGQNTAPTASYGSRSVNIPGGGNVMIPNYGVSPLTAVQPAGSTGQPNPQLATDLLTKFPGYQFGLDQGTQALDRSAASRGLLLSGGQLKDAQQFGTNYAMSAAWQPYISELNNAASLGENAAAQTGNAGTSAASGAAQSQLAAGQSQAAGTVGMANNITSGISQLAGLIPTSSYNYSSLYPSVDASIAANPGIF